MISNRIVKLHRHKPYLLVARNASTTQETKAIQPPNPKRISTDMVGPPDPVSNLRKVIFKIPPNETDLERKYRKMRSEVQEWNQKFWEKHNSQFYQSIHSYFTSDSSNLIVTRIKITMILTDLSVAATQQQPYWNESKDHFDLDSDEKSEEREEYVKNNIPADKQNLTADEMSVFYKAFLDKNWKLHLNYNKEWYKKNFTLLGLAIRVKMKKLLRIKD